MGVVGVAPGSTTVQLPNGDVIALNNVFDCDVAVQVSSPTMTATVTTAAQVFALTPAIYKFSIFDRGGFEIPRFDGQAVLQRLGPAVRPAPGWRWIIGRITCGGLLQGHEPVLNCRVSPWRDDRYFHREFTFAGPGLVDGRLLVPMLDLLSSDELAIAATVNAPNMTVILSGFFTSHKEKTS